MPKVFGRTVSPVVLVGATAAVAYLAFTAIFPEETVTRKPVAKKATVKVTSKAVSYTEDDYKLKFANYSTPVKNSFKPLIVKRGGLGGSGATPPSNVPSDWTGGDGNWVYSGRVIVDGVSQALLENRKTGDAEFLVQGQRWMQVRIVEITSESVTLEGPGNSQITLVAGASEPTASQSVTAPSPVAPGAVGPGLAGQIGGNVAIQPTETGNANERPGRRTRRNWNNNNTQGMEE
jgi:hypothetical protein